ERARATPDGTAFVAGERAAVSWRALADDVDALAAALASPRVLGLAPGDRVAVIGQTTAESAIAALAIVAAGGVAVGVYPTLPPTDVVRILRDCGATIVFCDTFTAAEALLRA